MMPLFWQGVCMRTDSGFIENKDFSKFLNKENDKQQSVNVKQVVAFL